MAEINLLKNELQQKNPFSFRAGAAGSLYWALAALGLLVLLYAGMLVYKATLNGKAEAIERARQETDSQIAGIGTELKQATSAQRKLHNLRVLLGTHVFWSELFEQLEDFTYRGAVFDTLQFDADSGDKLLATGFAPSYVDLGKFIAGLELSDYVSEVNLITTGLSEGEVTGYSFNVEIVFDQSILSGSR